jgi:hypothetical protein
METITPPNETEIDTPFSGLDGLELEPSVEASEQPEVTEAPEQDAEPDGNLDEIVVEPEAKPSPIGNGEGDESSISSAPNSDDDEKPSEEGIPSFYLFLILQQKLQKLSLLNRLVRGVRN